MNSLGKPRQLSNFYYGLKVKAHLDHLPPRVLKSRCLQEPGRWCKVDWWGLWQNGEPKPLTHKGGMWVQCCGLFTFWKKSCAPVFMLNLSNSKRCQLTQKFIKHHRAEHVHIWWPSNSAPRCIPTRNVHMYAPEGTVRRLAIALFPNSHILEW